MVATAGGALAQLIEMVTVSQPAGQPQLVHVVPGVGPRADHLDGLFGPGPSGQPARQVTPRVIISGGSQPAKPTLPSVLGQDVGSPPSRRIASFIPRRRQTSHGLNLRD